MASPFLCVRAARLLFPALCLLLLVSGCICDGEGINEGDVNLVSLDEEWQMGDRLARRVAQQLPLAGEGALRQYVQRVGERLAEQTDLAQREWTFHVVRSGEVNAFALPGGHVYVNAGLIRAASSPSELAGVLAHEVAHGTARHSTERLTQAYGIDAVVRLVSGEQSGLIEQILTRVGRRGAVATFSRDDEREADRLGLEYLRAAGYDPRGMVRFFETLLEQRRERPNALEQFFTSHPLTEERLANARQQIEQQSASGSDASAARPERFRRAQQQAAALLR